MTIIKIKINCEKIQKEHLFKGTKGTYLDVDLLPNKNGPDEYGNDYMVIQQVGKEARMKGVKGVILGNAKIFTTGGAARQAAPVPAPASPEGEPMAEDDVPF